MNVKKGLIAVLTAAFLLCAVVTAAGESVTALEAFESLMASQAQADLPQKTAGDYLGEILDGAFNASSMTETALADALEPLSAITNRDIAACASARGLKAAQVRNAWYKALAGALRADIGLHPVSEEGAVSAQTILSLFLTPGKEAEKAQIRGRMSREGCAAIARTYQLPEAFVNFLIMDEHWDDDSWENDNAWKASAGWDAQASDAIGDIVIGSRDADGSTLIADTQATLISLGYLKGKADGVYGPRTQKAVVEFQLANGMKASGAVTAELYDALNDAGAVARWDYGEDFWDSRDFDTDTDTADRDSSNFPDTPDSPDTDD